MAVTLTFDSLAIAAWHHLQQERARGADAKEIAFPNSAGRDYMLIGQGHSDNSARAFIFAEDGIERNRITGANVAAVQTIVSSIKTKLAAGTRGTLTYDAGGNNSVSVSGLRIAQFMTVGPIRKLLGETTIYAQEFWIMFSEWDS